jgi:hypothetical protein
MIENSNSCDSGPDGSVQEFWKFYEVDFDFDSKTPFHPHDLFCQQANLLKF